MNDADIEMAELAEAGRMAAAGVCLHCEDPLDPFHPKWAKSWTEKWTAQSVVDCFGPAMPGQPFHEGCYAELERIRDEDDAWRREREAARRSGRRRY